MKAAKKVTALLLVLVLMLALGVSAYADGATITLTNATVGKSYALYKVFDATFGENDAAAYTTLPDAPSAFISALQASTSPFQLTANTAGTYNVTLKSGKTGADIAAFLSGKTSYFTAVGSAQTASSDTVQWTAVPDGYYYVTSSLGSVATIINSTSVTIHDKNQKPGPGPDDPDDPDSPTHYKAIVEDSGTVQSNTASYGDTIYWQLTAKATAYSGDDKITQYVAHDELGAGFRNFAIDSVYINGNKMTSADYTVSTVNNVTTVTIPWVNASGTTLYPSNSIILINCHAVVGDSGENYTNTGWFTWTGHETAEESEKETVNTYTYDITVDKYTGEETGGTRLAGAKFVLMNGTGSSAKYYKLVPASGTASAYVTWVDSISDATEVVTLDTGKASFEGLANGTYYLKETKAPDGGYNPLEAPVEVVINNADVTKPVQNNTGTVLPETGGFGTTLFLIIGSALFVATAVLLVTKKRMYNES